MIEEFEDKEQIEIDENAKPTFVHLCKVGRSRWQC